MTTTVIVDNVSIPLLRTQRDAVLDAIKMVECTEGPRRSIIEHTEALHVIDVNSGNRSNKAKNQEDTALEVNLLSAS